MNRRVKMSALMALVCAVCVGSPARAEQKPAPAEQKPAPAEQKPAPAEQKTVKQTFRESSFTTWKLFGGGFAEAYCKVTPAGLLCELEGDGIVYCGAKAKFRVRGDFTAILGYRLVNVPKPDKGYGAGVVLFVGDEQKQQATVQRIHMTSGSAMYMAHRGVPQENGSLKHDGTVRPSRVDFGKLKFERKGDVLTWSVADGDFDNSDKFVVLRSEPFSSSDILVLEAKAQSGGATTGAQVLITDVEVTGDDLVLPAQSKFKGAENASATMYLSSAPPPVRPLSPVLVGSTVFAFLSLISIIVYLIRRNLRRA